MTASASALTADFRAVLAEGTGVGDGLDVTEVGEGRDVVGEPPMPGLSRAAGGARRAEESRSKR